MTNQIQPMLPGFQDSVAAGARSPRRARRIREIPAEDFPIRLNRALAAENLSFGTYAIMLAARGHERISVASLAIETGYSYHALRNQVRRTPWWRHFDGLPLSVVALSAGGVRKLLRIAERLARTN